VIASKGGGAWQEVGATGRLHPATDRHRRHVGAPELRTWWIRGLSNPADPGLGLWRTVAAKRFSGLLFGPCLLVIVWCPGLAGGRRHAGGHRAGIQPGPAITTPGATPGPVPAPGCFTGWALIQP